MHDHEDTHLENVRERIERDGLVAEMRRRATVEHLKSHMDAFYEHGSRADVAALCDAFDSVERRRFDVRDLNRACLIEEILSAYGRR